MRIATSQKERWLIKAAEWNPELSTKYRTNRSVGRPRKRWEDDVNEFLKQMKDETDNLTESSKQSNETWITATDRGRWALLEENYTMTSEERHENNARKRRNFSKQISEVCQRCEAERRRSGQHHIIQSVKKIKKRANMKVFESRSSFAFRSACCTPKRIWKSAAAPQSRTC